jgi:hypothetical protein
METWRDGDMKTWTWTWKHGDIKQKTDNRSPGDFPYSVYCLLIMQTEICRLSVSWRRNKQKLSVCKRTKQTKRTCLSMLI